MIDFSVAIDGRKRLVKGFGKLERSIQKQIKVVLPEIGLLLEAHARDMVPVDTGRLRASIGHFDSSYLRTKDSGASASDAHWVITQKAVEVGTNVPYAGYVLAANPFFDSAIRQSSDDIDSLMDAAIADGQANAFGERFRRMVKNVIRRVHSRRRR